jgi:hypothetical protein
MTVRLRVLDMGTVDSISIRELPKRFFGTYTVI